MARPAVDLLAGRLVGLVDPPVEELSHRGHARVCRARADLPDTVPTLGASIEVTGGIATAFDRDRARRAAIGEALERYSSMAVDPVRLRRASAADLRACGERCLDPCELVHFLDSQYGSPGFRLARPPGAGEPIPWLIGFDLVTGEPVHVPAARITYRRDDGPPWYPSTSNGVAVAADPIGAALSALLELLERDAFMLMWYHRLRFPHVELDRTTELLVAERLADSRLELVLIDLTEVHDVPIVVAVVHGQGVYGVGAAAARHPSDAVVKAFCEAVSVHAAGRDTVLAGASRLRADEIRTFSDHADYYLDPGHQAALEFLADRRPRRRLHAGDLAGLDAAKALRRLTRRLRDRGIDTVAVDLTPVEAEPLGLHAYAVVSPQLLALDCAHAERQLGNPRLLSEPTRRGWRPDLPTPADLNHDPHPFP